MIKVTCYGKVRYYKTHEQAINHFLEGVACCDPNSSECMRYWHIISELEAGKTEVDDNY